MQTSTGVLQSCAGSAHPTVPGLCPKACLVPAKSIRRVPRVARIYNSLDDAPTTLDDVHGPSQMTREADAALLPTLTHASLFPLQSFHHSGPHQMESLMKVKERVICIGGQSKGAPWPRIVRKSNVQ